MNDVVLRQVVEWVFKDSVSSPLAQVKNGINAAKQAAEQYKQSAQQSMSGASSAFKEQTAAATNAAKASKESISQVKADTEGVAKAIKDVPKEHATDFKAKTDTEKIKQYRSEAEKAGKPIKTPLSADDKASPVLQKYRENVESAEKSSTRFRDIVAGSFVGQAAIAGVNAIRNSLTSMTSDLSASIATWSTFEQNMHNIGQSKEEIAGTEKQLQDYAAKTIYSANDMAATYSQLAAVGTKGTTQLVEGFGGLAAASNDPIQAMRTLSQQATQMAAKPKVQWQDFMLILQQSPAGMAAVAKTMGMSTGELVKNVQAGKVATQDFFDAIKKTGTNANFNAMATQYKTIGDAMDGLRESLVQQLTPAWGMMSKVGIDAISGISDKLSSIDFTALASKAIAMGKEIADQLKSLSSLKGFIVPLIVVIGQTIETVFSMAWNVLKTFAMSFAANVEAPLSKSKAAHNVGKIKAAFDDFRRAIAPVMQAVGGFLGVLAGNAVSGILRTIQNIAKGFTETGNGADSAKKKMDFSSITKAIQGLSRGFNDWYKGMAPVLSDLGEIIGIIAKGAWEAFSGILKSIGEAFGIAGSKASGSQGALNAIKGMLDWLLQHKRALETVGKILVGMFAFKIATHALSTGVGLVGKLVDYVANFKGIHGILDKVLKFTGLKNLQTTLTTVQGIYKTMQNMTGIGMGKGGAAGMGGAMNLGGSLQTMRSAGGFGGLSTLGKVATGAAGVGVAASSGLDLYSAIKEKNPTKKFEDYGKSAGTAIGGGIGLWFGGPLGAALGAEVGKVIGGWTGKGAKQAVDGWNMAAKGMKPPEGIGFNRMGYEAKHVSDTMVKAFNGVTSWIGKNWKGIGLLLVNPVAGAVELLYDNNKGFKKWVDGLWKSVKGGFGTLAKNVKGAWKKVVDVGKNVLKGGASLLKGILLAPFVLLVATIVAIGKLLKKPLEALWGGIKKVNKKYLAPIGKAMIKPFTDFGNWFAKDTKVGKAFTKWSSGFAKDIKKMGLGGAIKKQFQDMSTAIGKSKFGKDWDKFWSNTNKTTTKWGKDFGKWWDKTSTKFGKGWNSYWGKVGGQFKDKWSGYHSGYDKFASGMNSWWNKYSTAFGKNWNGFWGDVGSWMQKKWSGYNKGYNDFASGMNSWWDKFSTGFLKGWNSFWGGVGDWFKKLFGKINDYAKDAINGVIGFINGGIDGVNWVIHLFGGSKNALGTIKKLANGTKQHTGGPALINDQPGPQYRELFRNPGENWQYFDQRNVVVPDLKPGAVVVPAKVSEPAIQTGQIPHYAGGVGDWLGKAASSVGSAVGGAANWVGGKLSAFAGWAKDKVAGITDFLKHPLQNLEKVWDKAVSGLLPKNDFAEAFGPAVGHKLLDSIVDPIKKLFEHQKGDLEAKSVAGQPKAAIAWLPTVKRLMQEMGAKPPIGIDAEAAAFVREIARESGGNPAIRQTVWDKNMANGNPAMGLLQFIPGTFMSYAVPGHTNILNGEDQIRATINAYMHSGAWDRIGTGRQINFLANGGHFTTPTPAVIAEDGDEFVINPSKPNAPSLLGKLVARMSETHPKLDLSGFIGNSDDDSNSVSDKLDRLIGLLTSIDGKDMQPVLDLDSAQQKLTRKSVQQRNIYQYTKGERQ